MKFLIDAHLPPGLRRVFAALGHEALHTQDLPDQNATRDADINQLSMQDNWVVVTKDTDFYFSHLLQGRPWKLVLVRTGNMRLSETISMFERHLPQMISALASCTLIEMDRQSLSVIA